MRPLNHFRSAEDGTLRFTALDFSGDNVIIAGHVLYLKDIRYFVETLIDEVKQRLKTRLFFGLDVVDVNWSPGVVHEEPRNTTIGYSCFRDPRNVFPECRDTLLRTVLTHPLLRGCFHCRDEQGRIRWRASTCFAYMDECHEVEMMLFSATQTSVGEPGRGTEIASHLISNVSGGSIRNVLVMFQYFCMMGTFNKSSHLTGRDLTMMRVPHPEIGRLWMLYLAHVRPLVVVWQRHFHGQRAEARARDCLFFGPHRAISSAELSRSLSYHFERLLRIKMPISLWRQVSTWFLNHHSARFPDHIALSNRAALAAQMGHSEAAHDLYAADVRLPSRIDFHIFFKTMRTSGAWHELVGFDSSLLQDMEQRHGMISSTERKLGPTSCSELALSTRSVQPMAAAIAEGVRKLMIPDLVHLNTQTRASDLASLLNAIGADFSGSPSQMLEQPVTHMLHPSRLKDLRKFLGDDSATFRHTQQALAVELIASRNPSILLIGPTGM